MISSIILTISLFFALAAIYKLCGDVRHYKLMYENEMGMNHTLWDLYKALADKALADRSPRKQADLDAEVYAKAMQSNPGMEELDALMSPCRQDGAIQAVDREKLLATARKRRTSQKKYRDARHAKGEIQVFDDNRHLIWVKAADCAWIRSGKRWKRVLRSSKEFADYNMTGAVCYVGTMPHPERKAA